MPRVITPDMIEKIAELAGRGYSKAAIGRELSMNRATVRRHWPREQEPEEGKVEQTIPALSLEEEFRLLNKKLEINYELKSLSKKIENYEWETESLMARGQFAVADINFLRKKLDGAKTITEVDEICALVNEVEARVPLLLAEDEPLWKQRREREEKKRQEEERERQERAAKRREENEALRQYYIKTLPWYVPLPEYTESIINTFFCNYSYDWAGVLSSQLGLLRELECEDDVDELGLLYREFLNIITGHPEKKDRIVEVMAKRAKRIFTARDEDVIAAFNEWLNCEEDEEFVEGALKLSGILTRLAEERYIDTDELLEQEASQPKEPAKNKRSKADKARQTLAA